MKKPLLLLLLICSTIYSQEQITFGIYQDVKLGLGMDKQHGNDRPTFDMVFNLNMEGNQQSYYYFSVQAQYEHADLFGGKLDRYGVNLMWNLNKLIIDDLTASFGFGGHVISRPWIEGALSGSIVHELNYEIFPWLAVGYKIEINTAPDLEDKKFRKNVAFGLVVKPFNKNN